MKHQVFFLLSMFSLSVYSMKNSNINKLTSADIAGALTTYCLVYPDLIDVDNAQSFINHVSNTSLTFNDKIAIIEAMKHFPQTKDVLFIGGKAVLFERESYEVNQSIDPMHRV